MSAAIAKASARGTSGAAPRRSGRISRRRGDSPASTVATPMLVAVALASGIDGPEHAYGSDILRTVSSSFSSMSWSAQA